MFLKPDHQRASSDQFYDHDHDLDQSDPDKLEMNEFLVSEYWLTILNRASYSLVNWETSKVSGGWRGRNESPLGMQFNSEGLKFFGIFLGKSENFFDKNSPCRIFRNIIIINTYWWISTIKNTIYGIPRQFGTAITSF